MLALHVRATPERGARGNRVVGVPAKNTMPPIIPRYLAGDSETPRLRTLRRNRYQKSLPVPLGNFHPATVKP